MPDLKVLRYTKHTQSSLIIDGFFSRIFVRARLHFLTRAQVGQKASCIFLYFLMFVCCLRLSYPILSCYFLMFVCICLAHQCTSYFSACSFPAHTSPCFRTIIRWKIYINPHQCLFRDKNKCKLCILWALWSGDEVCVCSLTWCGFMVPPLFFLAPLPLLSLKIIWS